MRNLKSVGIWAAGAAVVAETGLKNVLFSTLITVGTPATTAGFVYEIVQMRTARLQREAEDRIATASNSKKPAADDDSGSPATNAAVTIATDTGGVPSADTKHRLASMIVAREHFVDIYGGSPEAVSPIYQKVAADMLVEDERMFVKLDAEREKDLVDYEITYRQDEARLRELHGQVAALSPARLAVNTVPGAGK